MITEFTITDWNSFVRAIRDIAVREHYRISVGCTVFRTERKWSR